tara:strand:- start:92 stop:412 length:321 start_codon:yes stop_codon:yes gene_type:complete
MQRFDVIFDLQFPIEGVNYVCGNVNIEFDVETLDELWSEIELSNQDGSMYKRLLKAANEQDLVSFEQWELTHIINQVDEIIFSLNQEDCAISSLDNDGNPLPEDTN